MSDDPNDNLNKSIVLPKHIQKSINNIIKREGCTTYETVVKPIITNGVNYLGELYQVDIKGKTDEKDKGIYIFVKRLLPVCETTVFSLHELYTRESFMYNELSDIYKYLQDEANVPLEDRYNMVKSYGEHNPDAIILENIAIKGYKTLDRTKVCPIKLAELSIQQLARFHGLSFVLKCKRPDYYERKIKPWTNPFRFNDEFYVTIEKAYDEAFNLLDDDAKKMFEPFKEIFRKKYPRYQRDDKWTISCLCHGDYRVPNMLTKKIGDEISDVIPVDYQFIYHACPIYDFIYFIFLGTDQKFRRDHLFDLKQLYFNSLSKFLLYFNIDIEDVYPRKEFERAYTECLDIGLMYALLMLRLTIVPEDNVPGRGDSIMEFEFKTDENYNDRIRGIIDDFIQWGYL